MNAASFIDLSSAAIVVGGTLLSTMLRCGFTDCGLAIAGIARIGQTRFDADQVRAELAVQVRGIQQDGLLRTTPRALGDRELDEVNGTLIGTRSVAALVEVHEGYKARRQEADSRAVRTLAQAAELAPVFGLAGTLVSLTQLPADGIDRAAYMGAISMAVLSTLYGLLLANFILAPLSRLVERAATKEERERQKIVDWLARQVAPTIRKGRPIAVPDMASA